MFTSVTDDPTVVICVLQFVMTLLYYIRTYTKTLGQRSVACHVERAPDCNPQHGPVSELFPPRIENFRRAYTYVIRRARES